MFANVPLPAIRHVFLTHQHSDHNADYGNSDLARMDGRAEDACRRLGPAAARENDQAVLRDERL